MRLNLLLPGSDEVSEFIAFLLTILIVVDIGKHLQSTMAISQLGLLSSHPFRIIYHHGSGTETDAIIEAADGLDANNGPDTGVILCSGIGNEFDALDVGGLQIIKFAHVAYFLAVDINLWTTLTKHINLFALHTNQRQFTDGVKRRSHISQERALHIDIHATRSKFELWPCSLHNDVVDGIGFGLQLHGAHVFLGAEAVNGFVADIGDAGQNLLLLVGNHKAPGLIADSTRENSGVSRIEDRDVGKGHGLPMLVGDAARQMEFGLVDALHEILLPFLGDADGIQAHHLPERIF